MARDKNRFHLVKTERIIEIREVPAKSPETALPPNIAERIGKFFDHSGIQSIFGLLGGLVGVFLDGRYFSFLAAPMAWSLHRSTSLVGLTKPRKVAATIACLIVSATLFFFLGIEINKHHPTTYTPADNLAALKKGLSLPAIAPVTNIYNNYPTPAIVAPQNASRPPILTLTPWENYIEVPTKLHWDAELVNGGDETAIDEGNLVMPLIGQRGPEDSDKIFETLEKHAFDPDMAKGDIQPGSAHTIIVPIEFRTLSTDEREALNSGAKVLFLPVLIAYKDRRGNRYITESCEYYDPKQLMHFCWNHNKVGIPWPIKKVTLKKNAH